MGAERRNAHVGRSRQNESEKDKSVRVNMGVSQQERLKKRGDED